MSQRAARCVSENQGKCHKADLVHILLVIDDPHCRYLELRSTNLTMRVSYSLEPRFRAIEAKPTLRHSLQIKAKQKAATLSLRESVTFWILCTIKVLKCSSLLEPIVIARYLRDSEQSRPFSRTPLYASRDNQQSRHKCGEI